MMEALSMLLQTNEPNLTRKVVSQSCCGRFSLIIEKSFLHNSAKTKQSRAYRGNFIGSLSNPPILKYVNLGN